MIYLNKYVSTACQRKRSDFNGCILLFSSYPACVCLLKVDNRNTRIRCEICSKLTIKAAERRHWHHSVVFIVNIWRLGMIMRRLILFVDSEVSHPQ